MNLNAIWSFFFGPRSNALLDRRDDMRPDAIYDIYYAGSGLDRETVIMLLVHVAQELNLVVERLRPSDRFFVELKDICSEWDSVGILFWEVGSLAKKRKVRIENPIETIDDYIRAMHALDP